MIVHLTSLNFLLLFFCRRTMQEETLHDPVVNFESGNENSLDIRNNIQTKCIEEPTTPLTTTTTTTTANPITTTISAEGDCNSSAPLEATTNKALSPAITAYKAPRDTLEDVNSYCMLLENAFKLAEEPPLITPKYNNRVKIHFADSPLLKKEPAPQPRKEIKPCKVEIPSGNHYKSFEPIPRPHKVIKPCKVEIPSGNHYKSFEPIPRPPKVIKPCKKEKPVNDVMYQLKTPIVPTTVRPKCEQHKPETTPQVKPVFDIFSFLSSPSPKPVTYKNDCPPVIEQHWDEIPIQEIVEPPMIEHQYRLQNPLPLPNYLIDDYKWDVHVPRFLRDISYKNKQKRSNYPDQVSERFPNDDMSSDVDHRIIGGTVARSKEVPYQVALYQLDYFICGSSLISKYYILTAGHCLYKVQVSELWLRVGSESLLEGGETYKVRNYTIHPDYNTTDFDIAIVRSASPIKFGPKIIPVRLPSFADPDLPANLEVIGSGWGATDHGKKKKATYTLHKITLLTVDRDSCRNRIMPNKNKIGRRQICTNLPILKAGMCFGDSGGPIVSDKKLVGIVSWGSPCAIGDADVYTNVRVFLPWIYCEMKKLDHKYSDN